MEKNKRKKTFKHIKFQTYYDWRKLSQEGEAAGGWQVKIGASTALGKHPSSIHGMRIYFKSKVPWKMKKGLMCDT